MPIVMATCLGNSRGWCLVAMLTAVTLVLLSATRPAVSAVPPRVQVGLENLEQVQRLLRKLPTKEREVVRMFYLEGRSYEEISTALHLPVNTIGPVLSRARKKLQAANGAAHRGAKGSAERAHHKKDS